MLNGQCPRCNAKDVYKKNNGIISGEKHVYVTGLGFTSPRTDQTTFLCTSCGYYENYIADETIREKVTQKWEKA